MAALRRGVRTVIIPEDNLPDLEEIDQTVRRSLNFVAAERIDDVIDASLLLPEHSPAPAQTGKRASRRGGNSAGADLRR